MSLKYQQEQDCQQLLMQLDKQTLAQLQHQRSVCETLFSTLSSAEKVALGMSKLKEYGSYDNLNTASKKNQKQLENELASKLYYLQGALQAYRIQHGEFLFPEGLPKEEILQDITKWETCARDKPKALQSLDTFKKIIQSTEPIKIPKTCFNDTDFKRDEQFMNEFTENMLKHKKIIEQQDKEVQKEYEEHGTCSVPVHKKRFFGLI